MLWGCRQEPAQMILGHGALPKLGTWVPRIPESWLLSTWSFQTWAAALTRPVLLLHPRSLSRRSQVRVVITR